MLTKLPTKVSTLWKLFSPYSGWNLSVLLTDMGQPPPPTHPPFLIPKICHIYIPQCWNLSQQVILYTHIVIPYPSYTLNNIQKIYKSLNTPLEPWVLLTSVFLQRKSLTFVISRNADIGCIFINMVAIFMMSAKLATLGLLKVKVF